eukprot:Opistho-2@11329
MIAGWQQPRHIQGADQEEDRPTAAVTKLRHARQHNTVNAALPLRPHTLACNGKHVQLNSLVFLIVPRRAVVGAHGRAHTAASRAHSHDLQARDDGELVDECIVTICHPDVGHICAANVVALGTLLCVLAAEPPLLDILLKPTLPDAAHGEFTHIARRQLPHLRRDAVLFNERLLGHVEHERIIRGERHVEAARKVFRHWIPLETEEERVVAEGAHGNAHLRQIVQILQHRHLAQQNAVADRLRRQKRRREMVHRPRLSAVWAQLECVEAARLPHLVQHANVGIHVIDVVRVRGVLVLGPVRGRRVLEVDAHLGLALVVDAVKAYNLLQCPVQIRVAARVERHLKEWHEYVVNHVLERLHMVCLAENRVQAGHLDQPADVLGIHLVLDHPVGEAVPLVALPPVDRYARLRVLVLALLEVIKYLFCQTRQIAALDVVVRLEKYLAQAALANRIVLEVEFIKAVECVAVGVHVERIHAEVVRGELQRVEHLLECEVLSVAEDDDLVAVCLERLFDEAQEVFLVHA